MTELVDLLAGARARHALAHRDITTVFRILRDAGVSQSRLARATGQQQSEISEIISGRQVQSVALHTAERAIGLARRLRSVEVRDGLASLQEAAAARRDSACQDLARELATLRSAA